MQFVPMPFVICSNTSLAMLEGNCIKPQPACNYPPLQINAVWDAMAAVWGVTSDDIPDSLPNPPSWIVCKTNCGS